jgi:hypothetical protein
MKAPFDVPPRMKAEGIGLGVQGAVEWPFDGGVGIVHLIWLDGP